jgi:NAD-dependent SIR2 family protein deacetylase
MKDNTWHPIADEPDRWECADCQRVFTDDRLLEPHPLAPHCLLCAPCMEVLKKDLEDLGEGLKKDFEDLKGGTP